MEKSNLKDKVKRIYIDKKEKFVGLKKSTKIAIIVGIISVILAVVFSVSYSQKNKYGLLFSGLDSSDAANITKELDSRKVDTKIEGNDIYVPRGEVDKLRIELAPSVSNGSKGFEMMDEGSSVGMTDEEFKIKQQRMAQGELEKTIKTFPQVENVRVHITPGVESVFAKESKPGKAGVYLNLKSSQMIDRSQVKAIASLVSASSDNIPKQNVTVVDQNMKLLSEGLFDEDGNEIQTNSSNSNYALSAEMEFNENLNSILEDILEPIFGAGKFKVAVNAKLNFDKSEKTEIKIDPEKVIKSESRSEKVSSNGISGGSAVDNNMGNNGNGNSSNTSKDEKIDYEIGKVETKTISTDGEIERITASVAINGNLDKNTEKRIISIVEGAIGIDSERGDKVSVVGIKFDDSIQKEFEQMNAEDKKKETLGLAAAIAIAVMAIGILGIFMFYKRKRKSIEGNDIEKISKPRDIQQKSETNIINKEEKILTVEEKVKILASKDSEHVTELLKIWLNE